MKIKQSQQEDGQTLQHAGILFQMLMLFFHPEKSVGCYYVRFAVVGREWDVFDFIFFENCRNANKELKSHVTAH